MSFPLAKMPMRRPAPKRPGPDAEPDGADDEAAEMPVPKKKAKGSPLADAMRRKKGC